MSDTGQLENRIDNLLADDQYANHPLREALSSLFQQYKYHQSRTERLASISDNYQWMARERKESLERDYDRQTRRLQKIVLISDGFQSLLHDKNAALQKAASHDALTGLPNRRHVLERINTAARQAAQSHKPFSLAVIDVDDFKAINDQHGHAVGDHVLVSIARTLMKRIRSRDVCARWGGEEFMLLLSDVDGTVALKIAERLRQEVENLLFQELPQSFRPSISAGVAEHRLSDQSNETIIRADRALYEAKRSGRNKVMLAEAQQQSPT